MGLELFLKIFYWESDKIINALKVFYIFYKKFGLGLVHTCYITGHWT